MDEHTEDHDKSHETPTRLKKAAVPADFMSREVRCAVLTNTIAGHSLSAEQEAEVLRRIQALQK